MGRPTLYAPSSPKLSLGKRCIRLFSSGRRKSKSDSSQDASAEGEDCEDAPYIHGGLTTLMVLPSLDLNLLMQFTSRILTTTNPAQIVVTALTCVAGMGAWAMTATLHYDLLTRIRLAATAGAIATIATLLVAIFSSVLLQLLRSTLWITAMFGAVAVFLVGLSVAGVKIPAPVPPAIASVGLIMGIMCGYFLGIVDQPHLILEAAVLIAALEAGLIATVSVMLAALAGEAIKRLDEDILRVVAGVIVCTIALAVAGLSYPSWLLLVWMGLGAFLSYYKKRYSKKQAALGLTKSDL